MFGFAIMGLISPYPDCFNVFEVLRQTPAGCIPQNAVMIGDRLDNDIAPANAMGMKTVWIKQGFGRYSTPQNEKEKANDIVNNLNDVCRLLL